MWHQLPKFKDQYEAMKHAIEFCEQDSEPMYACYGGVAHAESYSPSCYLKEVGIKVLMVATDEIWHYEHIWAQTYNIASLYKKTKFGGTMDALINAVHSFTYKNSEEFSWHGYKTFEEFLQKTSYAE